MATYLLEIGCEEIPASMVAKGVRDLGQLLCDRLAAEGLAPSGFRGAGGPRRLEVRVDGIPPRQPHRSERVVGPPVSAAFGKDGEPTRAAIGFAKRFGIEPAALERQLTPRGECLAGTLDTPGRAAGEVIAEIAPRAILSLSFGKMMRWGAGEVRFVRAIRNLVSLLDDQVVAFEVAGVRADRTSFGHRFLGRPQVVIANAESLATALRSEHVISDPEERRQLVMNGLLQRAESLGARVEPDDALLEEIVYLVEAPSVLDGQFDTKFLELPHEILITSMRQHQKSFPLWSKSDGQLLAAFLAVANVPDVEGHVRRGYERVLRARLADAAFFWSEDRKTALEQRVSALERLILQEKLGSYGAKTRRLVQLAPEIARAFGATAEVAQACAAGAGVAKADLTTQMVGEFPELQGVTGGLYLAAEGADAVVARAVYEHYLPVSFEGPTAPSPAGAALATADKLDTLVGCFGVGLIPTGTRDPLGLRRAAQGVVRTVLENGRRVDLGPLLARAASLHEADPGAKDAGAGLRALRDYLSERLDFVLRESGYRADTVSAVIAREPLDFVGVLERAAAIDTARAEPAFESVLTVFKRVVNIAGRDGERVFDATLFSLVEERNLAAALADLGSGDGDQVGPAVWLADLARLRQLAEPLAVFFERVLVMDPDPLVRENRLRLLRAIAHLADRVGDLSRLAVGRES